MDFKYLYLLFKARAKLIVVSAFAGAVIGILIGAWLPRNHASTAMLLIGAPGTDARFRAGAGPGANVATVLQLIASRRVAARVVAKTGLSVTHPHVKRWRPPPTLAGDPVDWIAAQLIKDTRFASAPDTSAVTVTTISEDSLFSAKLANAYVDAFLEINKEMQDTQARSQVEQLQQSVVRVNADLQAAHSNIAAFRTKHPNLLDPGSDMGGSVSAALATQLAQVEVERGAMIDESRSPSLQNLRVELERARARFADASSRYGSAHPLYQSAASEVTTLESSIRKEEARLVSGARQANSNRAAALRNAAKQREARSAELAELHEEYAGLQRALVAAESSVVTARNALRQAEVEPPWSATVASVFAYATSNPDGSVNPLAKTLPLGGALGLLLGSIGALLAEETFPRLRNTRGAIASLGFPLLACIPSARKLDRAHSAELSHDSGAAGGIALVSRATEKIGSPSEDAARSGDSRIRVYARTDSRRFEVAPGVRRMRDVRHSSEAFIIDLYPSHPVSEAVRNLRTQLLLKWRSSGNRRPVSVQSPTSGDGKSFVSTNLAIAFAQANLRTVLVDLNLRAPHLHALFDVSVSSGASTILAGQDSPSAVMKVDTLGTLFLLPAGPIPENPQELISGSALTSMLDDLAEQFDVVILDGPAWDSSADAQLIAAEAGDAIVVARSDRTPLHHLQEIGNRLQGMDVRLLGAVVNEH